MTLLPLVLAAVVGAEPGAERVAVPPAAPSTFSPYQNAKADFMYNLLFCDRLESFLARRGERPTEWQRVLAAEPGDVAALQKLAANGGGADGRIRYLAFARLREAGVPVAPKQLLGVIVEVGLDDGLDTLAAYADGGIRYVNHSGKILVVEGVEETRSHVRRLFDAAQAVVARIGPWTEPRRPPPGKGVLRLTFLVSDGLYYGEGPLERFQSDAMAGPVFREATNLLVKAIELDKRAGKVVGSPGRTP